MYTYTYILILTVTKRIWKLNQSRAEQIVNIWVGKFDGAEWYMYIKCCATWTDHKKKKCKEKSI